MEKVKALGKKKLKLIKELTQGREFVKQLKRQIGPLASPEECDLLLGNILSSLENSISKALLLDAGNAPASSSSSVSLLHNHTPKTEILDSSSHHFQKSISKKRKKSEQWSKQISISGPHGDDGYSWRKYGQKDILGANHPRAYYRCTHRNTQGCLATKQVQKADANSSTFEITYKGRHSCKVAQSEIFSVENQKHKQVVDFQKQEILTLGPNHKVENFSLTKQEVFTSFSFAPTPLNPEIAENSQLFSNSIEPFSEPTYLSLFETQNEEFYMDQILQSSESDISTPTSISNSPFGGHWDMSVDLEPTFDITELLQSF